jgi:heme-degrading monooxygenase HmoA
MTSQPSGDPTVARVWHGAVPVTKSNAYLDLMRSVALDDYRRTPGNRGAFVLRRVEADIAHFVMLTFWQSAGAIKAFAGENIEAAKYYEFEPDYLIELEPSVLHYEVFEDRCRQ